MPGKIHADSELVAVKTAIRRLDPMGIRTGKVFRDTLDQLYDGQRTGRYRWDQLFKTERDGIGGIFAINLHREFDFQDGAEMDFQIAGVEVDCKYSQSACAWMIPPEKQDRLCLLVGADDERSNWSMGLVSIIADLFNSDAIGERKPTFMLDDHSAITWIFNRAPLPPNALLQLDNATVNRIMSLNSSQKRINELFRSALGRVVGRAVVATVAQRDDYMKCVRANGGARTALKPEGIVILVQYTSHADIARALGMPVPVHGESVSVRLAPANAPGFGVAAIDERYWRVATPTDTPGTAPDLPGI